MLKKLLLISLFISIQVCAAEKSLFEQIQELPNLLLRGAISAPSHIQSKAKEISSNPAFEGFYSRTQELAHQSWNYTGAALENAQNGIDRASDWAVEFGNQAAKIVPQKAAELTNAVKNNPYKTIVIIGGILAVGKIVKDALKSEKDRKASGTEFVWKFRTDHNPVKLTAQALALATGSWYAYTMKNNIVNFFTKKAVTA